MDRNSEHESGYSPASFIGEPVADGPHVVANRSPFGPADDANVLHREDGEEQVLVGAIIPILVKISHDVPDGRLVAGVKVDNAQRGLFEIARDC